MGNQPTAFAATFFHGTRADLAPGDRIDIGYRSNFLTDSALSWVYFTSTLDAAIWGAELTLGEGRQRIYLVEPTGPHFDDPNVTDKKFPGNPTMSYRSQHPLRVLAEVVGWEGHPPDMVQAMKAGLARLAQEGGQPIID